MDTPKTEREIELEEQIASLRERVNAQEVFIEGLTHVMGEAYPGLMSKLRAELLARSECLKESSVNDPSVFLCALKMLIPPALVAHGKTHS